MLPSYVICAIFIILVYNFTHENRRYAATASAIRQIWSGNCRLGCRPSLLSDGGISGLSGLVVPITNIDRVENNSRCVCESCPCALIENFLKCWNPDDIFDFSSLLEALKPPSPQAIADGCLCEICPCELIKDIIEQCRPATQICSTLLAVLYYYYEQLYETLSRMTRVLECRTSCQRHAQLVNSRSQYDSNENFTLVEKLPKSKQVKAPRAYLPSSSASGITKQSGSSSAITKQSGSEAPSKFSSDVSSVTPQTKSSGPSSGSPVSSSSAAVGPSITSYKPADRYPKEPAKGPKPKSMAEMLQAALSQDTLMPVDSIPGTDLKGTNCSKCVEKGKTCLGGCPSADKKKNKKK